jgi:peptidyl-prolyl cis-trans isomerase-like 3
MANSGRDSNKSQFFITYAKQPHLDGQNTIFGKVIDGLDTLEAMERVPVNNKNRPLQEIKLTHVRIGRSPLVSTFSHHEAASYRLPSMRIQ